MKILLVSLLLPAISCSGVEINTVAHNGFSVEKEFIPYVEAFEKECDIKINLHLRFAEPKSDLVISDKRIGYCWPIGEKFIHINIEWWVKMPLESRREELIFHELGHCMFYRLHDDSLDSNGIEKSVMSAEMFKDRYQFKYNREKYIKELCRD